MIVQITQLFFIIVLFLSCLIACTGDVRNERIDSIIVEVTGSEYNWYFRYPGEDGILGTEDDKFSERNLYLPDNANVILKLKSEDYVYNITLPDIGIKEIAVPELDFSMQFETKDKATWTFKGDQFCGFSHETLIGEVFIRNQASESFYTW